MARVVGWFWVLVVVLVAQTQNSDKVDVKTFLENIKKMLQETVTVEKMRKQQENRMKRRKDKKNKIRIKKMIINKLANPYIIFRRQHTIINVNPPSNRDNLQDNNNRVDVNTGRIAPQTVNNVLRANHVFNPLSIDRLKKLLNQIRKQPNNNGEQSTGNNNSSSTPSVVDSTGYENELKKWFREVYSKIQWFWDMVYRLFIVDEQRFEYLEEVLCKGDITNLPKQYYLSVEGCSEDDLPDLPERLRVIKLSNSNNMPCESLIPQKLEVNTWLLAEVMTCVEHRSARRAISGNGQCTPLLYTKARFIGDKGQENVKAAEGIRPIYNKYESLCYNLVALNFFALKNELYNVLSSGLLEEEEKINYIFSKAKRFILYIQFIEKIFIEKITPAIFDMCYIRCLCEDIGIGCTTQRQRELPQEEKVIIILWNIQKDGYLSFIELLPKLVSFKEGVEEGKVTICDKIQNDFKGIMGNIGRGIVGKRDKLREIKEKIDQMESRGEVDKSVYKEIIKLVEDVRRELIPVREGLIKLWQNRIESATSLDDLICVLDSFKILISNISIDNKNILELYLSDLLSGNGAKTKGLRRFIDMVGSDATLYVRFQNAWAIIWDLFAWVSALDYSIYSLITTFNILKCVIGNATIEEFLDYLVSWGKIDSDDATFLKCFMGGGKTIRQCAGERYSIIEDIIGDVTIDSLGNLKDRIENLKKEYDGKKWGDIPAISDCCAGECKGVDVYMLGWCWALTSPIFKEKCCKSPLGKCCDRTKPDCNPSSEPFCLSNDPSAVKCNSDSPRLAGSGSPCESLAQELSSLFSISYNDDSSKRIFCDVIDKDKYAKFCEDPVYFINNIQDSKGRFVMANTEYKALKCKCLKCRSVIISPGIICRQTISVNYTKRSGIEKFLQRTGLLEKAQQAIKGGLLKELGKCPF